VVREQHYLDLCRPEYNILKTAGSSLGYTHREDTLAKFKARRHSEETIKKISETIKGKNHPFFGNDWQKKHSEETLKKMRDALKGRTHSEETRKKIVESMGTSVKVTDTETGITTIYPSKRQVARELNTSLDTVRRYIVSSKPFKDRYLIENII
jgi:group I intron endonuclease